MHGAVSQNWAKDRSCNYTGLFMVKASIAGAHLGSGGLQCGSPLAQDLGLIQTRPEKKVGCDYKGSYLGKAKIVYDGYSCRREWSLPAPPQGQQHYIWKLSISQPAHGGQVFWLCLLAYHPHCIAENYLLTNVPTAQMIP